MRKIHYICKYTPVELLTALGYECELLDDAPARYDRAEQVAHPNLCGFGKSILEAVLAGEVEDLILVDCCDTIRSVYDILRADGRLRSLHLLDLLHGQDGCSVERAVGQLKRLMADCAAETGQAFDPAAFRAAFRPYVPPLGPHLVVLGARMNGATFDQVQKALPLPVENATCAALRAVEAPEEGDDPDALLADYARRLLGQLPCLRVTDPTARRALWARPGLAGVVYHTLQFCDFYGFEYAALRRELALPLLKVETDGTTQSQGQLATRIGAFAEALAPARDENGDETEGTAMGSYYAGIDSGSATTDVVILDAERSIVAKVILPTGAGASHGAERALELALEQAGLDRADLRRVVTTGYGRAVIGAGDRSVTEITCHARGAFHLDPSVRTVLDIGGQDSKVIRLDDHGGVTNFVMNDKCAAGTGRFLEMMARTLELSLEEMGTIGLEWKEDIRISAMCTVFADSEVVSLVAQDKALADIVHGLDDSVAIRAAALYRRVGGTAPVMMTGGVTRNEGVVRAIEARLGTRLVRHPDAQLCGALGAALFAAEG